MVGCPGCGSKLVFDIDSQKMKCSYCGKMYPVSSVSTQAKDAEEAIIQQDEMEVTVFTCSQCGAEIIADEDEAVTWCSFCGSPTTLQSRLSRMRKPNKVIPFQITKEDCIKKYEAAAKKQIYAPRDLIRKGKADGFRGIYMPFWTYSFKREGHFSTSGKVVTVAGNVQTTTNYLVQGNIDSYYDGLSHDASVAFDDSVSEQIAPYWVSKAVDFDECYLNGFFGDAADQNENEYENKMYKLENDLIAKEISVEFMDVGVDEDKARNCIAGRDKFKIETESSLDMYPVWFMSYRDDNRVSYATVNGQTGKLYSDFPASKKRFMLLSLLTALPIFLILNLLMTPSAPFVLFIGLIGSLLMSNFYKNEVEEIYERRFHISFNGFKKKNRKKKLKQLFGGFVTVLAIGAYVVLEMMNDLIDIISNIHLTFNSGFATFVYIVVGIAVAILMFIRYTKMNSKYSALSDVRLKKTNLFYLFVSVAATVTFIINPVNNWAYYMIACSVVAVICVSIINLIHGYNLLSSVQPKQFKRAGGGDNA